MMRFGDLNIIAVIVANIVFFIIGFIWYGLIFSKSYMTVVQKLYARSKKEWEDLRKKMVQTYTGSFITMFILTLILACMLIIMAPVTVWQSLLAGFWLWLGFIFTIRMNNLWFERIPIGLLLMDLGYYLVSILAMSVILFYWK